MKISHPKIMLISRLEVSASHARIYITGVELSLYSHVGGNIWYPPSYLPFRARPSISVFPLFILCFCSLIDAQQPYVGLATTDCNNPDTTNSVLGYTCTGPNRNCQGYLTFRSQPPFNSVSSISTLLASDLSQLSQINSVSETATFETIKLVIVPVNCSGSGSGSRQYYQVNTSYTIKDNDTYLFVANNTFRALSTCQALQDQNSGNPANLVVGATVTVPLRCACPTKNQTDDGVQYLLTYLIAQGDTVTGISTRFGVNSVKTLEANTLSEENPAVFAFTIFLVPLENLPSSSQTIEPPPPPSPTLLPPLPNSSSNEGSNRTWVYVVAGVLGGTLKLIIGTIFFCNLSGSNIFFKFFYRRKKKKPNSIIISHSFEARQKPFNKKLGEGYSQEFLDSISGVAQSLKVYTFKLPFATDNFSSSCLIKGSVYRGEINGEFVAIKKVNGDVSNEITLLNRINHSNVILLSGVCFNEGNWYLVHEYAANGNLNDWIHGYKSEEKVLNWTQRMQIALDVATGLTYLHSFTNPPHVHKDIKCSNVLLGGDFRAKIANFALARPAEIQEGKFTLTRHVVGTKGYMAPEYLENGLISTKLDVYAFGVLMLEIFTGKEVAAFYAEENQHLSDVLNTMINKEDEEESLKHFIDPCMEGNYPSELALLLITIIDSCLKKDPTVRPAMYEIQYSLSNILNASLT